MYSPTGRLIEPESAKSRKFSTQQPLFYEIDKARSRANNALLLSLASFFCIGVGVILGAVAIFLAISARKQLVRANVEEGRGYATAAIVIGVISLVAQSSYIIYFMNAGFIR
ncbi:MAG: DUF4190 domain-containing protein [Acidobacteriota bacterium]